MAEFKGFGQQEMSVLKNPFLADKIKSVGVYMYQSSLSETGWNISGHVEFQNGATEGKQNFTAFTFDEVVLKIKNFIGTL